MKKILLLQPYQPESARIHIFRMFDQLFKFRFSLRTLLFPFYHGEISLLVCQIDCAPQMMVRAVHSTRGMNTIRFRVWHINMTMIWIRIVDREALVRALRCSHIRQPPRSDRSFAVERKDENHSWPMCSQRECSDSVPATMNCISATRALWGDSKGSSIRVWTWCLARLWHSWGLFVIAIKISR